MLNIFKKKENKRLCFHKWKTVDVYRYSDRCFESHVNYSLLCRRCFDKIEATKERYDLLEKRGLIDESDMMEGEDSER